MQRIEKNIELSITVPLPSYKVKIKRTAIASDIIFILSELTYKLAFCASCYVTRKEEVIVELPIDKAALPIQHIILFEADMSEKKYINTDISLIGNNNFLPNL